ncbi:MAG: 2-oxo acid dehydrogenase subunit E2 [Deltaproteobacteria bacterium]|nr:2-oxo acid dehydrogenase subunit E2 [Deltaproteobacteria bacterium]
MRRPAQIPDSLSRGQLDGWVPKRIMYINKFHISNWYPNQCLQARIDLTAADALRKRLNAEDPDPSRRVTFNHLITKAAANALRNHVLFNGKYTRRDSALVHRRVHAANVVDTGGMATRIVLDDTDTMSLREVAAETHRLVTARRVTLGEKLERMEELQASRVMAGLFWTLPYTKRVGRELLHVRALEFLEDNPSTVVVTNPGTLGVQDCKAMFFFGQLLTCLRIMAIEEEAVLDQAGQLSFRKVLPVGLDYDQRLCDAGPAARLLNEIRRNLEQPEPYSIGPAVVDEDSPMAWPDGGEHGLE